jgi:hypothetical protein
MTVETKDLSKQALNKITKTLYQGGEYDSKAYQRFLKAEKEFNEARKAVNDEVEQVLCKINDDEEAFVQTRGYKKLEGEDKWESIVHFDQAGSKLSDVRVSVGYSYEGYDSLAVLWNSSSMRC